MLNRGTTLRHYRITEKIGEGGMGEVYRARDDRLNRDVALKVLPSAFASDAERMARFQREAQLLASLNHPNIGAIYGLEEADGVRCLVLELVEGETLAERVARGPVPLEDALKIARQMADALEAAHDRGVIHRDLKPGNVKLTPEGTVKVLDFGLAKAFEGDVGSADLSRSPTLTSPATQQGVILGTAAYMSPEQAKGRPVDERADVWAFGVVLLEMLTGRQVYAGDTVSETLASVIKDEPPWASLPAETPAWVRHLLRRCLEKDPRRRLQAVGEARLLLEDYLAGRLEEPGVPVAGPAAWRRALPWAAASVLAAALAVTGFLLYRATSEQARVVRSHIPPPPGTVFDLEFVSPGPVAVSPDGTRLAFTARDENGEILLYVRPLDSLVAQPLANTQDAAYPFWSPDSKMIGFIDTRDGKLKKISAAGGPPLALCAASNGKGGTWNRDDVIVFTPDAGTPLFRVPAAGGEPEPLTKFNEERGENSHRFPQFLPDGNQFIFFARSATQGENAVMVSSLDGLEPRLLLRTDSHARYASGHLLFVRQGTLMARPFDPGNLEFTGEVFPLAEDVETLGAAWRGVFSVSENGVLVYRTGEGSGGTELRLVDREGKVEKTLGGDVPHVTPRLSPDGRHILVIIPDEKSGTNDLWIYEIERGIRSRFTFDPAQDYTGPWSPDGETIFFTSDRKGTPDIFRKSFVGSSPEEVLLEEKDSQYAYDVSPDGRHLAYLQFASGAVDIGILPLTGERKPSLFIQSKFFDVEPRFSPDGKWLVYTSTESGQPEVYVTAFPGPGRKWQISTAGGSEPQWRGDGKEIYYVSNNQQLMAVEVSARGDTFSVGAETALFETPPAGGPPVVYDAFRDGRRFLVNTPGDVGTSTPLILVTNWTAELPSN